MPKKEVVNFVITMVWDVTGPDVDAREAGDRLERIINDNKNRLSGPYMNRPVDEPATFVRCLVTPSSTSDIETVRHNSVITVKSKA